MKGKRIVSQQYAVAHCLVALSRQWNFQFTPVAKARRIVSGLGQFETTFVESDGNMLAFCHQHGNGMRFMEFDNKFRKVGGTFRIDSILSKTAFALVDRNEDFEAKKSDRCTQMFWVDPTTDKIETAQLKKRLDRSKTKHTFSFLNRKFCHKDMKTGFKPAAVGFKGQMVVAFVDDDSTLNIATSSDGTRWNIKQTTAKSVCAAPAICKFKEFDSEGNEIEKLAVSWVIGKTTGRSLHPVRGTVNIGLLETRGKNFQIVQSRQVKAGSLHGSVEAKTSFAPDLCATDETICLAYTDGFGQFQLWEGADMFNIRPPRFSSRNRRANAVPGPSQAAPSLFFANNEVVCAKKSF